MITTSAGGTCGQSHALNVSRTSHSGQHRRGRGVQLPAAHPTRLAAALVCREVVDRNIYNTHLLQVESSQQIWFGMSWSPRLSQTQRMCKGAGSRRSTHLQLAKAFEDGFLVKC